MAWEYQPASLAEVSSVEVLTLAPHFALANDERPKLFTSKSGFPIIQSAKVFGDDALAIADLWRKLPAGEDQDRCHNPPFGLRFYQAEALVLFASICWECSNIWIKEGETNHGYIFNPKHEISHVLLNLLKDLSKS